MWCLCQAFLQFINIKMIIKFNEIKRISNIRRVEIRPGNYCNYDCSFCSPDFKSGTRKPLHVDKYKKLVSNVTSGHNDKVFFSIHGAEPTLWNDLPELLSHIKETGSYVEIFSNGSRTIRWWGEFLPKKLINRLSISHHPQQNADPNHIASVVNMAKDLVEDVWINVTVPAGEDNVKKSLEHFDRLKTLIANIVQIRLTPVTAGDADHISLYTQDQIKSIVDRNKTLNISEFTKKVSGTSVLVGDDFSTQRFWGQEIVLNKKNMFHGWECFAGVHRLIVETDEVFRAICKVNGPIGYVSDENITWANDPVICNLNYCTCEPDIMLQKKNLNSSRFA